MKTRNLFLATLALLATSAAFASGPDSVTPSGIVKTAYAALQKGDLKHLTKALSGQARTRFGNAAGAEALHEQLAPFSVTFGRPVTLSRTEFPKAAMPYAITTYSVDILGKSAGESSPSRVITAQVSCTDWDFSDMYNDGLAKGSLPPESLWENVVTQCWITDLN
jgi:hypothetical protein